MVDDLNAIHEALDRLKEEADRAYCNAIDDCRYKTELLGSAAKLSRGGFGLPEFEAHRANAAKFERHYALMHAINTLRPLLGPRPGSSYAKTQQILDAAVREAVTA
jgi:hypothetical protein